jgi:hypothetical protein
MTALTDFEGKKIFVKLISNKVYTGIVQEVEFIGNDEQNNPIYIISLIDKFGLFVSFSNKEFKFIEEQK